MAKYTEPFDETREVFEEVITTQMLDLNVNFKILADNRQKDIYKIFKANDLVKHMTNNDVVIVVNEAIYDKLDSAQQHMVAEEATAGIHYDLEKEKLIIKKGDVQTHFGILKKFGADKYLNLHETINMLYSQEKDQEAEMNKE
jgi:hypothetical protein